MSSYGSEWWDIYVRQAPGALSPCTMPDAVSASQFSNIDDNYKIKYQRNKKK